MKKLCCENCFSTFMDWEVEPGGLCPECGSDEVDYAAVCEDCGKTYPEGAVFACRCAYCRAKAGDCRFLPLPFPAKKRA